jgi:hypothetical protein
LRCKAFLGRDALRLRGNVFEPRRLLALPEHGPGLETDASSGHNTFLEGPCSVVPLPAPFDEIVNHCRGISNPYDIWLGPPLPGFSRETIQAVVCTLTI